MYQFSYLRIMDESDLLWVNATEMQAYQYPWTENGFIKAMDDGLCYIFATVDDEPLGYACFITVLDELHLLNFCVSPDHQGQGIGQAAMQALLSQFRDSHYEVVLLEVRASNDGAIHLYEKLGFKVDGRRPNYYRTTTGREDAVLMSYRFDENQ